MSFNDACHACKGTGVDAAFGGTCGECWIDADRNAILAQRYAGIPGATSLPQGGDGTGKAHPKSAPTAAAQIDGQEEAALVDWLREQTWSDFAQSLAAFYGRKGFLSPKQLASAQSMKAKCDARQQSKSGTPKAAPAPVQETSPVQGPGMFLQAGVAYKVQQSRTSGKLYAKVLTDHGFEYAAGMIRKLREEDRMTLEQAKAYGRETGTCCNCGAELTDPNSIAAGIGPICASKF